MIIQVGILIPATLSQSLSPTDPHLSFTHLPGDKYFCVTDIFVQNIFMSICYFVIWAASRSMLTNKNKQLTRKKYFIQIIFYKKIISTEWKLKINTKKSLVRNEISMKLYQIEQFFTDSYHTASNLSHDKQVKFMIIKT